MRLPILRARADAQEARNRPDLRIGALGDGSDYVPFIHFIGIASLDLGFGGESPGGVYHSIYDDFYWYTHFADTDFVYGRALSQTAGTALMRMADAELLPFGFHDFADTVHTVCRPGGEAAHGRAGADRRDQSGAGRRRLHRKRGSKEAVCPPGAQACAAVSELRSAGKRRRVADPQRRPLHEGAGGGAVEGRFESSIRRRWRRSTSC